VHAPHLLLRLGGWCSSIGGWAVPRTAPARCPCLQWPYQATGGSMQAAEGEAWPSPGVSSDAYSSQPATGHQWSPPQPDWPPAATPHEGPAPYSNGLSPIEPYLERWAAPAAWSAAPPSEALGAIRGGGGQPMRAAAPAAVGGGRVVRSAGRGRVGIDIDPRGTGPPFFIKALLSVLPFLRSWGGFM
jgi:hypothetical protein